MDKPIVAKLLSGEISHAQHPHFFRFGAITSLWRNARTTFNKNEAIAPTLAYDHTAIPGKDGSVPIERAAHVPVPTLVMNGGASYPFMYETARALSKAIPHGQLRTLEGQDHGPADDVLAPVLKAFFPG